jgi:hypothetical protein
MIHPTSDRTAQCARLVLPEAAIAICRREQPLPYATMPVGRLHHDILSIQTEQFFPA